MELAYQQDFHFVRSMKLQATYSSPIGFLLPSGRTALREWEAKIPQI